MRGARQAEGVSNGFRGRAGGVSEDQEVEARVFQSLERCFFMKWADPSFGAVARMIPQEIWVIGPLYSGTAPQRKAVCRKREAHG